MVKQLLNYVFDDYHARALKINITTGQIEPRWRKTDVERYQKSVGRPVVQLTGISKVSMVGSHRQSDLNVNHGGEFLCDIEARPVVIRKLPFTRMICRVWKRQIVVKYY